jgi:hypothetical protein
MMNARPVKMDQGNGYFQVELDNNRVAKTNRIEA